MEVIIIDSVSQEWEGTGGILNIHGSMTGNSFTNWNKVTPHHNAFIQKILQSNAHIVATIRTKTDYTLTDKNGKMVPEKVGLKGITRDGLDYEFTVVFDLDIKHMAEASKDRTGLFMDQPEEVITSAHGKKILEWCNSGISLSEIKSKIYKAESVEKLREILRTYPEHKQQLGSLQKSFRSMKKTSILNAWLLLLKYHLSMEE